MPLTSEIWKPVPDYEGLYEVSTLGQVRSLGKRSTVRTKDGKEYIQLYPSKMLCQSDVDGYKLVYLSKPNKGGSRAFMVHRLVAMTFIPNPANKPEVNHKDRNHGNNNVSNLEWVTKRENTDHALQTGWDPGAGRRGKTNSKKWYERIKTVKHEMTPEIIRTLQTGHKKQSKPCRCIELDMTFISVADAARYIGYDSSTLSYLTKQGKKVKGGQYTFEFV